MRTRKVGTSDLVVSEKQIFDDCVYQIGAIAALASATGAKLSHVKPHGALYNQAVRDPAYARPIIAAADLFGLPLMALPDSEIARTVADRVILEGFADRRYLPDGSLVPRSRPDALVEDPAEAVRQAEWLLREKGVRTFRGEPAA